MMSSMMYCRSGVVESSSPSFRIQEFLGEWTCIWVLYLRNAAWSPHKHGALTNMVAQPYHPLPQPFESEID